MLVTLPFGPFGRTLNKALRDQGAQVRHMIFNAGDKISLRGPGGLTHRGDVRAWIDRLPSLAEDFTDLVIFGEAGPYNEAVLNLAGRTSARIWVLENGYFRPDWITLERGGANAGSRLPRDREGYAAEWPEPPEPVSVGPALRSLTFNISLYYFVELAGRPLFPRHVPAFSVPPWRQSMGHTFRYFYRLGARSVPTDAPAETEGRPYFLVCLQRDGDTQLLRHSHLRDNAAFLHAVMDSFSRHAEPNVQLVVKNHPLDPGLTDMGRLTRAIAIDHGLEARMRFIDGGSLARLCRGSRGLVVNNSSSAFSALGFGTPVKALGRALFDFEGLADQQPLDRFWAAPTPPDPDLFARFRAQVMARTQINGSFDSPRMIASTAKKTARAMLAADGP